MRRLSHVVAPLALLAMVGPARAVPAGFTLTPIVDVNGAPNAEVTSMAWAPDGSNRLFITGRQGAVWIVKDGAVLPQTFVQIGSAELYDASSETGLLSIAFDPDFVRTGHVYLFVTMEPGGGDPEQQILQYTAVGDTGTDRQVVIRGLATEGANHNGGTTAFGPDGLIYWAIGDNGAMIGLGDDAASSASKIGRAPAVPNAPAVAGPFNDGNGPNFDYIFARGFRNPYTMTFEPASGKLWVDVVGTSWEQIFVVPEGAHAGYPGENLNVGGGINTISPVIAYATGDPPGRSVGAGGAVRAGGTTTFTTGADHLFRVGNNVIVSGIDEPTMNGTFTVTQVTGARTFRVANPGTDITSGNGTVASEDYGRVVAGGTFYDGSQLPEAYRGDFFFGDFLGGDYVRVEVTGSGDGVARMERFHTGLSSYIDSSTGPDGALYIAEHGGEISKITFDVTEQSIVAAPLHLQIVEGGRGVVTVSLAQQPASNVSLSVQRMSGDTGLTVSGGAALTFTTANWNVPQIVEISSASDGDSNADVATFSITGTALDTQTFDVRATEPIGTPPPPPDAAVFDARVVDARVIDAAPVVTADASTIDARITDARTVDARGGDGGDVTPMGDDGGCGCRAGTDASSSVLAALALATMLLLRRRRGV